VLLWCWFKGEKLSSNDGDIQTIWPCSGEMRHWWRAREEREVVTGLPLPPRRCSSSLRTQSSSYQETTHCIATRGTSPIERETRSEASEPAALGAVAKTRVAWWNRPPFARGDDADLGVWVGVGGNHGRGDGEDYTRGLLLGGR
jgi:hypothetical protein